MRTPVLPYRIEFERFCPFCRVILQEYHPAERWGKCANAPDGCGKQFFLAARGQIPDLTLEAVEAWNRVPKHPAEIAAEKARQPNGKL